MAKADWSCDECGEILPADHFLQVTDREVARTSDSTRVYRGTRGGLGVGGSSSTSYRYIKKKLCPACVACRVELARRARARRRVQWLVGAGALATFVVVGLYSQPKGNTPPPAITTADSSNPQVSGDAEASPATNPSDTAKPVAGISPLPTETADAETADGVAATTEPADPAAPRRFAGNSDREMAEAIQDATPGALNSGVTAKWSGGYRHGYVVVSGSQQRGADICRNAYWTVINGDNQIQGPSAEWCKADGGTWVKRE